MYLHLLIYLLSFTGIWIGSGLAIRSVERLSSSLKMSSFALSFLVLGFFTSISELSVGVNAILNHDPEIYVGNLIGASIVLFLLIIPLLALVGHSVHISQEFQGFNLPASLITVISPVFFALDGQITASDSVIAIALYLFLVISIQSKRGLFETLKQFKPKNQTKIGKELAKILFGVLIIFVASKFVVEQTLYFSDLLQVSPFIVSLLIIAIGTNIPELSLVIRSAFIRNHQVAFGDYVGSAAFNTFLLGSLTLIYPQPVTLSNNYLVSLLFLVFGLALFYYFCRTKNTLTRIEALILLAFYLIFVLTEIGLHQ